MTNTEKRILFLQWAAELTIFAKDQEIDFIVTCFKREDEQQHANFKAGLSQIDGITERGNHQDWLAWDLGIIRHGLVTWNPDHGYKILGAKWESLGGYWGGKTVLRSGGRDYCHFGFDK